MSFQDLGKAVRNGATPQRGDDGATQGLGGLSYELRVPGDPPSTSAPTGPLPGSDPSVVAGVFQMNTAVTTFKRLVNSLGTPKDTVDLRERVHKSRQYITQLAKDTAAKLKDSSAQDHAANVSTSRKLSDAKLAKDFQAVLREFEKAQHLAAEREAAYTPADPTRHHAPALAASSADAASTRRVYTPDTAGAAAAEQRPLMAQRQRQEMLRVENEVAYTEAVIEEREQGIQEIQHQITQVNEIFRDLAVLVREQGVMIDDIEANIENTQQQTAQANKQLLKAARSQRESNSFTCWVMAVFAIGLFILFLTLGL